MKFVAALILASFAFFVIGCSKSEDAAAAPATGPAPVADGPKAGAKMKSDDVGQVGEVQAGSKSGGN